MTGKICGTGSWAPDRVWDNNDLAKMVETSDQWIRERTGVVQRHIAKEDEDTVTMTALKIKVFSGIRHLLRRAFCLSTPKSTKARILTASR